jgi:Homeodomain-like domain
MRAYSQDLRDRVLRALGRAERPSDISRHFEVSRMWVYEVRRRWEEQGCRSSLPMGGPCLVPLYDGVSIASYREGNYGTSITWLRRNDRGGASSNTT